MFDLEILPPSLTLYSTYHCQLACEHCFLTQTSMLNNYSLDFQYIKSIVEEASKHNVFMIRLSGGDPLLHPNIYETLELISSKGMLPLLGVTGVNITKDQVLKIKQLGVPCIQVSLDGPNEESNSFFRGEGIYKNVIQSIKNIIEGGINANLAICITKENQHLIEVFLNLSKELGIFKVKVAFLEPIEGKEDHNKRVLNRMEKESIISICKRVNNKMGNDWITIPGVNLSNGKRLQSGKYPSLIIGADGVLRIDEFSEPIGHIKDGPISRVYSKFIRDSLHNFMIKISRQIQIEYNISSIEVVEQEKVNAAALVYRFNNENHILISKEIPLALQFFSILHEAGHIALGSLLKDPKKDINYDKNELDANLWALKYLRNNLNVNFYQRAVELAYKGEEQLNKFVLSYFLDNIIDYWEV